MKDNKMLNALKKYETFLVCTHINPDPDALSSQLVMGLYLKSLGKKVHLINNDAVPERLKFLPQVSLIKKLTERTKIKYDAAVIVDCGDLNRIGNVKNILEAGKPVFNIDHHVTNNMFGDNNLVVKTASSTAEVLFDLLKDAKCSLTRNMAILLYSGIMSDTGSFRYETTSSKTHLVVSQLMEFKFSVGKIYKKLYETTPMSDIKHFVKVVNGFDCRFNNRVVSLDLHKRVMSKFSDAFDLRDKIFSYLRAVDEVEVIVIFSEVNSKQTRVNFRSQSKVDVAKLAYCFKGGGHSGASGCLIDSNIKTAKERVFQKMESLYKL